MTGYIDNMISLNGKIEAEAFAPDSLIREIFAQWCGTLSRVREIYVQRCGELSRTGKTTAEGAEHFASLRMKRSGVKQSGKQFIRITSLPLAMTSERSEGNSAVAPRPAERSDRESGYSAAIINKISPIRGFGKPVIPGHRALPYAVDVRPLALRYHRYFENYES